MATQILDYSRDGKRNWRQLPWRRIVIGVIMAYGLLYVAMRATGVITYAWGASSHKATGPAYAEHNWESKSESIDAIFSPAMALEAAVRDLGRHNSP
jgi:hypothetical protein